jgi:hypothetical protein
MKYKVYKCKQYQGCWHTEAIDFDSDGEIYLTMFDGPCAEELAREYAQWKNSPLQKIRGRVCF